MKKVLALLVAMSASASAATVSYSHITPNTAAPFTDNFTLQKFDTTLGALTNILISFATSTTAEVDIFNNTGVNQSFTNASASGPLTLNGPASATLNAIATATIPSGTVVPLGNAFPGITGNNSASLTILPASFSAYSGTGTTTAAFSVVIGPGTFSGTSVPGVFFGGSAVAGGTSTITYTYTVPTGTPEPATMGLLGSALLGLGFLKFRTKKS